MADIFEEDKPQFLSLLEQHIDLDEIIPVTFYNHFYASTGRTRKHPLHALLWTLIIQHIFPIPTDQLLLTFLHNSKPLRDFCGFTKFPDASKITCFKQDFLNDLQDVFDHLVDLTEPICQVNTYVSLFSIKIANTSRNFLFIDKSTLLFKHFYYKQFYNTCQLFDSIDSIESNSSAFR